MRLVMFDIDGTLVDSSSFEDACYSKAVQEFIKHPIDTDWSKYINVTDSGILDEIIDRENVALKTSGLVAPRVLRCRGKSVLRRFYDMV